LEEEVVALVVLAAEAEAAAAVVVQEAVLSAVKPNVLAVQHEPEQTCSERCR
jgi:hypothetical protein